MKRLNTRGFSGLIVLAAFMIGGVLATAGWLVYDRQNSTDITTTKIRNEQKTPITPKNTSFIAKTFYDQLETGMTYDQVMKLADGQTGNCERSGAPAPTDYMYCTWQDDSIIITVSFKDQKVTIKTKENL